MNLLGRIFVILILVMSVLFLGFATVVYATHQNWYEVVNLSPNDAGAGKPVGLTFQLQDARSENTRLKEDLARLEQEISNEQASRRDAIAKLETEKELLKNERDSLQRDEADLVAQKNQAVATMEASQQTLARLRAEVDTLRGEIREAQSERDGAFTRVVELTDSLNQAESALAKTQLRRDQLDEQVEKLKDVLARNEIDPDEDMTPPRVDGIVLASGRDGLIEISIGEDDGLRPGHQLEVYRRDRYLGRIEVIQIAPDKSVAKIIPEFRKGSIQRSDRVATRIQ